MFKGAWLACGIANGVHLLGKGEEPICLVSLNSVGIVSIGIVAASRGGRISGSRGYQTGDC